MGKLIRSIAATVLMALSLPQAMAYETVVPFAGNTYVNGDGGKSGRGAVINYKSGQITSWNDPNSTLSFYVRATTPVSFILSVELVLPEGTTGSMISFSCNGQKKSVYAERSGRYEVGEFAADKAGYVKVDMSGTASPEGAQFARIKNYYLQTDAGSDGVFTFANGEVSPYWVFRGPSSHVKYSYPEEIECEWFYNETVVPQEGYAPDSYFCSIGAKNSYLGLQSHLGRDNNIIFSVWSPYQTDDPDSIPKDYLVKAIAKGPDVRIADFGAEGSGSQSFLDYAWKAGTVCKTLMHVHPNGDNTTDFTGYFCDENGEWHLIASFRRPYTDNWLVRPYSFVECFNPSQGLVQKGAFYGNPWVISKEGRFVECTSGTFTCDETGRKKQRMDYFGSMIDNSFYITIDGFFDENTPNGTAMTREERGEKPDIDFEALEDLVRKYSIRL